MGTRNATTGDVVLLSMQDYYPFGSPMPGRSIIGSSIYKQGYQGQEVDDETSFNAFELRLYDARIGGWLSPDTNKQHASPYMAMSNNPFSFIDPDGGWDGDYGDDFDQQRAHNTMAIFEMLGEACPECSGSQLAELRFAWGTGRQDDVMNDLNWQISFRNGTINENVEYGYSREVFPDYFGPGNDGISSTQMEYSIHSFEATNYINSFESNGSFGVQRCGDCLDKRTVGRNGFGTGLTYTGEYNPRTISGDFSYSYIPILLAEYPSIGHDRRYDNLKIRGKSELFTNTKAIGADWKFVQEQLTIAANPFLSKVDRVAAGILGVGLGLVVTPKTLLHFTGGTSALLNVITNYSISNNGVTNKPDIHKH